MHRITSYHLLLTTLSILSLSQKSFADTPQTPSQDTTCGYGKQTSWASVRYTTPRGLGYSQGYTTLEGFFAPRSLLKDAFFPFVDLRGHVFDNGKLAANAGMGLRYLAGSRIWGGSLYYDYRNTKRQHYNQVSFGVESLGKVWDFRLSGYLPVGWRHSPLFYPRFSHFSGHEIQIKRAQQFAFSDVALEAGYHLDTFKAAPLYFAAGPYVLTSSGETAWGGALRTRVDFFDRYLSIEANTSYDHFFRWIGQGQVSVNIPFGGKSKIKKRQGFSCSYDRTLNTRMTQRVDRAEIIPVGQHDVLRTAKNPLTGLPYHVVFVDNTSASLGTYESPYHSLVDAQNNSSANDILYIFSGNGSTTHMDAGITLKNGQLLLGSGTDQTIATTIGNITIPALTISSPTITNTAGDVVTLSSNNTVSGFVIQANHGHGLTGTNIENLTSSHNTFTTTMNNINGINLFNPSGDITISRSNFTGFSNTNFGNEGNCIFLQINNSSLNTLSISQNLFSMGGNIGAGDGGACVFVKPFLATIQEIAITENIFDLSAGGIGILSLMDHVSEIATLTINKNLFENINSLNSGIILNPAGDSLIHTATISECGFENITQGNGIVASLLNSSIYQLTASDNYFTHLSNGAIGIKINSSSGILQTAMICQNSFQDIADTSYGQRSVLNLTAPNFSRISNNNFTSSGASNPGFASYFEVSGGTSCLNFTYNNAASQTEPAYQWTNTSGTFNVTAGSDALSNRGGFSTSGVIGSCN